MILKPNSQNGDFSPKYQKGTETFLKWWAGVGRRGKEITGALPMEVELGCRALSSASAGRVAGEWLAGGAQAAWDVQCIGE